MESSIDETHLVVGQRFSEILYTFCVDLITAQVQVGQRL
jgi:hypothetical protein